ncbi:MAG: hypothetical protein V9F01_00060 [Chitinophagaceae bacterium]
MRKLFLFLGLLGLNGLLHAQQTDSAWNQENLRMKFSPMAEPMKIYGSSPNRWVHAWPALPEW